MTKKLTSFSRGVAHHTPGRIRLKVPKGYRHEIHKVKEALHAVPGVHNVHVNHDTGSVTVQHDSDAIGLDEVGKAIKHVASDLFHVLAEEEEAQLVGVDLAIASVALAGKMAKNFLFNEEGDTPRITGSISDLKNLVPLAFLGAAVYKAFETRSFWSSVSPLVLTYYAFDTYWRFNVAPPEKPKESNGNSNSHD